MITISFYLHFTLDIFKKELYVLFLFINFFGNIIF